MAKGSSKLGGTSTASLTSNSPISMSGKAFNKNDYTTWNVGTEVKYTMEDDIYEYDDGFSIRSGGTSYDGTVKEVHDDHLIIDVPAISDHMWVDSTTGVNFTAVKSGPKKRRR